MTSLTPHELAWAGRVWRGRVISTCPFVRPSLCSAVPLFGCPFVRPSHCSAVPLFGRAHLLLRNSYVMPSCSSCPHLLSIHHRLRCPEGNTEEERNGTIKRGETQGQGLIEELGGLLS